MRVDVSLPPGIMRDRALAERDFVTFPEIFFFSVLSNRCRAMWEAGSLGGFEELSVLSTHSLRPFIWSKCSEKLPTVQTRRDKHVQGNQIGEVERERKKEEQPGKRTPMWLNNPYGARQALNTHDYFEKGDGEEKGMKDMYLVPKSANSQWLRLTTRVTTLQNFDFRTLGVTTPPHCFQPRKALKQTPPYEHHDHPLYAKIILWY